MRLGQLVEEVVLELDKLVIAEDSLSQSRINEKITQPIDNMAISITRHVPIQCLRIQVF